MRQPSSPPAVPDDSGKNVLGTYTYPYTYTFPEFAYGYVYRSAGYLYGEVSDEREWCPNRSEHANFDRNVSTQRTGRSRHSCQRSQHTP